MKPGDLVEYIPVAHWQTYTLMDIHTQMQYEGKFAIILDSKYDPRLNKEIYRIFFQDDLTEHDVTSREIRKIA